MMLIHAATLILFCALAALSLIDARTQRLPDVLTLPLIVAGIAVNGLIFSDFWAALAGAALGYGVLVALELAYKRLRGRDGLGRGDAKLLAAGGAWCGPFLLPMILLAGSASALLYVLSLALVRRQAPDGNQPMPFGPWLALGIALGWGWRAYGPGLVVAW
ncbi:prepilin peptidase [Maricaulis salignorans]|uniref:prepilin peptidase n=1 Tax=Maricaulis salignorans TaxID=144026 RepID=UPI003A942C01